MSARMAPVTARVAVAALFACLLLRCGSGDLAGDIGGGGAGSETISILYMPDLSYADGARVLIVSADYVPGQAGGLVDSATTDSLGRFSFDSLAPGSYNIFGSKAGNVSYLAGVQADSSGRLVAAGDTLRDTLGPAGSLTATIGMQAGDDPRRVMVLILGSQQRLDPDAGGRFVMSGFAGGVYRVRLLPTLDNYGVLDTQLTVIAGVDVVLPDTIWMPYNGLAAVQAFGLTYDTLKQIVQLTWQAPGVGTVGGYAVYRTPLDSPMAAQPFVTLPASAAAWADSYGVQDETYSYRVRALDSLGMPAGALSAGRQVTVTSAFELVRVIGSRGSGQGQFELPVGLVVVGDKIFVAEQGNRRVQVLDTLGGFVKFFGNSGSDSLVEPWEIAVWRESLYIADGEGRIRVYDTAGTYCRTITHSEGKLGDLAVMTADSIAVTGLGSTLVGLLSGSGAHLATSTYGFEFPTKIAIIGGSICVTDASSRRAVFLNADLALASEVRVDPQTTCGAMNVTVSSVCAYTAGRFCVGIRSCASEVRIVSSDGAWFARYRLPATSSGYELDRDVCCVGSRVYVIGNSSRLFVLGPPF